MDDPRRSTQYELLPLYAFSWHLYPLLRSKKTLTHTQRLPLKVLGEVRLFGHAVDISLQHIPAHLIVEWVAKLCGDLTGRKQGTFISCYNAGLAYAKNIQIKEQYLLRKKSEIALLHRMYFGKVSPTVLLQLHSVFAVLLQYERGHQKEEFTAAHYI